MTAPEPVEHRPFYGRRKLGQSPLAHINGAAGMFYGSTVRCSCGWSTRYNQAPSKGGRKAVEELFAEHLAEESR